MLFLNVTLQCVSVAKDLAKRETSTNLSQFILQFVVFVHTESLPAGPFIEVMKELPVFSLWVDIILRERRKDVCC